MSYWMIQKFSTTHHKVSHTHTWDMSQWVNYMKKYTKPCREAVRQTMLSPYAVLRYVPQQIVQNSETISVPHPTPYTCALCTFSAPTRQQLHLHCFKAHGWLHPSQYCINSECTVCPICMTQFHTRAHLIEHLRYKGKMRACLENIFIYCDECK